MLHFSGGEHGLEAKDRLGVRISTLQKSLDHISHERQYYEQRIALLHSGHISMDLADELARKSMQYAAPGEFVLFAR